jgi:hypothetical protein
MNDTELDELLDMWTAPPAPASLRENVRAGFAVGAEHRIRARAPRPRRRWYLAAVLGAAAILLVVAQARPGAPPVPIPYLVDSEFVRYAKDGSSSIEMKTTSYAIDGAEILRSRSMPGHPFGTGLGRTLDAVVPIWSRLMASLTVDAGTLEKVRRAAHRSVGVIAGCDTSCLMLEHYGFARAPGPGASCIDGTVVGQDSILGHPVVAVRPRWGAGARMTLWMASDLGCFALGISVEEKLPDGTFRLVSEKRALRVNPPRGK